MILEHLAERPAPVCAAEPRDERRRVGRVREQVGPETAHRPGVERQHRTVPLRRLDPVPAQEEPGPARPGRPDRPDAPASVHPQMAPHRDAAFEPEQQVLSDRIDGFEPEAVDRLCHAGEEPPRVRRRRHEAEPDERAESRCRAMEGVAFGHPTRVEVCF